ncbi:MAG: acyl--CoA ligase [Candidatus Eisenbacteria bacterium]|uniref:Acyl--CoA ligase n=1 Tax=Eiseniibacteriota bacterium TaxID=2212470 RepID=A0A948RVA3_UNCEI|nr:acyl--CoA ligase [Candidatus Eisenbacteria bacterium]MBU1949001.1 acyl--CoA ligase [Candidatus Eisenbacteria bacterium]MBU2691668.1 acyl--CoA ligase [Candidatus Eisenbacteria bacterium]
MKEIQDTITRVLDDGMRRTETGVAFRMKDKVFRFDELEAASRRLAENLLRRGLRKGEKVALAFNNCFLYPIAFIGIQRAGGVAVPINPTLTGREIHYILDHADVRWFLLAPEAEVPEGAESVPKMEGILRLFYSGAVEDREVALFPGGAAGDEAVALPPEDQDQDGILIYTSGTTGVPKAVLLSQRNIIANARFVVDYLELRPSDRHAVFLPLFYSYAMSQMLSTLMAGGEVILLDGLIFPAVALKEMAHHGSTILAGVPTTYNLLVRLNSFNNNELPNLRLFLNAGGPVHPDRLDELCRRFPNALIINNYGCTEAGPRVTYLPHEELHTRRGSMGIAIPGMKVTLRDDQGREVGVGEMGEVTISGPCVMKCYYKNEIQTRRVMTPYGLRSGDWATKDKDGFLYFKGRKLDIINTGGEKVSAREVEDILMQHPMVKEVAVVGTPDPILGEVVKAFIVPETENAVTAEELRHLAFQSLARHKVPRIFQFCKQLSRTSSGKIRKVDLIG